MSHQIFYFLLFYTTFISTDITFHQFLELHSTLSEKRFSSRISFLYGFTQPPPLPHRHNDQNLLADFAKNVYPKNFCQLGYCAGVYCAVPSLNAQKGTSFYPKSIMFYIHQNHWNVSWKTKTNINIRCQNLG